MSKPLKLYVPVVTKAVKRYKRSYKITLIGVHNCETILRQLPMPRDIAEHMMAQKMIIAKGGRFSSIKVSVSPDMFQGMCREISRKVGGHYQVPVIDLIIQSGQVPIIQIIGNKTEFVRTKAPELVEAEQSK